MNQIAIHVFVSLWSTFITRSTDRYCTQATVVNGVVIPEGAHVIVPINVLHNNPHYWKNPDKFDPER